MAAAAQDRFLSQLNKFYNERVIGRKSGVTKTLREVCRVIQDVLREVEVQEPRFISSLVELNGHYEGLQVGLGHGTKWISLGTSGRLMMLN